jgi:hypothetical protein
MGGSAPPHAPHGGDRGAARLDEAPTLTPTLPLTLPRARHGGDRGAARRTRIRTRTLGLSRAPYGAGRGAPFLRLPTYLVTCLLTCLRACLLAYRLACLLAYLLRHRRYDGRLFIERADHLPKMVFGGVRQVYVRARLGPSGSAWEEKDAKRHDRHPNVGPLHVRLL